MQRESEMVKNLYAGMVDREWNRLFQDDFHQLEWNTTWRFLSGYLPKAGLILDAGGGPGRYAVELARKGYDVVLLDLVSANLERAKEEFLKAGVGERVKQVVEGTITDLSRFDDNSFDAVLCLGGPLSHVCPESERAKAVSELVRVAKRDACVFVSVISKYGVLLATPEGWPQAVTHAEFERLVETGDDYEWVGTGYCHFFMSAELEQLFVREKVNLLRKVGLEGLNTDEETTNEFASKYPEAWKRWLEIHNTLVPIPLSWTPAGI